MTTALSDTPTYTVLRTGVPALDTILGIGGWPQGRIIEITANPGAALHSRVLAFLTAAEAQRSGKVVAWVDGARRFDPVEAVRYGGVDCERLLVAQPETFEQAADVITALAKSKAVDVIIMEGGDWASPTGARMGSQLLKKLAGHHVTIVLVLPRAPAGMIYGSEDPWGNAPRFYASVRVQVAPREEGVELKVVKNKLAPPFRTASWTPSAKVEGTKAEVINAE